MQTSVHTDTLPTRATAFNFVFTRGQTRQKPGAQSFRSNGFKEPMTAGLPAKAFAFVVTDFLS